MITGLVTVEDYLAAYRLSRKRVVWWLNIAMLVLAVAGLILLFTQVRSWGVIALCTGLGGLVGEFVQLHFFLPRKVKRLHKQLKLTGHITYSWDAEILEVNSAAGHGRRKWKDYVALKEDGCVFLLYITDHLFEVVPKSWFRDASQLEEFRTHARVAGGS